MNSPSSIPPVVVPRLRMFAGPNGSGKSTIKSLLRAELLGVYINPDELQAEIERAGRLDFAKYDLKNTAADDIKRFFEQSALLKKADLLKEAGKLGFDDNKLDFQRAAVNAYFASVAADFIRQKLLSLKRSFTFETVMSAPDKVDFLARAQTAGYRTYLYFVATDNPEINISRVKHRFKTGGHDVPPDKIKTRFYRSLELLRAAVKNTNRAYIFDNSGNKARLLGEITDAETVEIKTDDVPAWFKEYVLDRIG